MTSKFSVLNERAKYLINELGDSLVVLDEGNAFTEVEITFNHPSDVIRLFHAGVHAGLDIAHGVRAEFLKESL